MSNYEHLIIVEDEDQAVAMLRKLIMHKAPSLLDKLHVYDNLVESLAGIEEFGHLAAVLMLDNRIFASQEDISFVYVGETIAKAMRKKNPNTFIVGTSPQEFEGVDYVMPKPLKLDEVELLLMEKFS